MKNSLKKNLINLINKFEKSRILIIGDIILDEYIKGEVSRISPEAPVPVINVKKRWFLPGGSGNVVNNLTELGAKVYISGIIGNDYFGEVIQNMLKKKKVNTKGILIDNKKPTILKTRIIARNQQVVRVDVEDKSKITKLQIQQIKKYINSLKNKIDGIILSDYGKGLVIPEIIEEVVNIKNKYKIPVIVDPKVEHFMNYKNVTIMTPNKKEASEGIKMDINNEEQLFKAGDLILNKLNLEGLLITRSEEGMSLFKKGNIFNIPTEATDVYDVTGAGDTVVSVLALCLSLGSDFKQAAILSNLAASETVKELGSYAITKEKLLQLLKNYKGKAINKI